MKKRVINIAVSFLLVVANSFAQGISAPTQELVYPHSLNIFMEVESDSNDITSLVKTHRQFRKLVLQLRKKQLTNPDEQSFLKSVFYHVQKKQLHSYDKYAVMEQTLNDKNFGCLTGTALYALVLSAFNYEYDIVELPNHVFIQVKGKAGYYLFESTLPRDGFKKLKQNIIASSQHLLDNDRKPMSQEVVGSWYGAKEIIEEPFNLIGLQELAGLQQFNEATRLFGLNHFEEAIERATEAYKLYPSKRNQELMQLIVNKILKHELLKPELRDVYLNQYVSLVKKKKLSQFK